MSGEARSHLAHGELGAFEGDADDEVVLGSYQQRGTWAPLLLELLCGRLLPEGGTLLDAGAHVGLVSIPVARRVGARCLAFEPAPSNARCLRRNVARHAVEQRVEVHEVALWDCCIDATLVLSPNNGGDHRVRPARKHDTPASAVARESVSVRCVTLDEIVGARVLAPPVVLKLDTQGSEVRALRGAERTLAQVEHVILEYFPSGLAQAGNRAAELDSLLASFPYATLLSQTELPASLSDRGKLLHALGCMLRDSGDEGFFDLLVSKAPTVTARARETHALP